MNGILQKIQVINLYKWHIMFDQTWNGNDKEKQRSGGPHFFPNSWNCHCSSWDSIVFLELIIGVMYRRCLTWTQSEGLVLCCLCLSFLLSAFSVQSESLCSSLDYFINPKSKLTILWRKWRQSCNILETLPILHILQSHLQELRSTFAILVYIMANWDATAVSVARLLEPLDSIL